uniref:Uncharacterized protein n=1 Tax=Musa acuminata subsp. malaccensis TaxID=214687 RepID=A0A804IRG5_MUSAM
MEGQILHDFARKILSIVSSQDWVYELIKN